MDRQMVGADSHGCMMLRHASLKSGDNQLLSNQSLPILMRCSLSETNDGSF